MTVAPLTRPDTTPDQDIINRLQDYLALAHRGEIANLVVIGNMKRDNEPGFYTYSADFGDAWRILGALEYAKWGVLRAMGTPTPTPVEPDGD